MNEEPNKKNNIGLLGDDSSSSLGDSSFDSLIMDLDKLLGSMQAYIEPQASAKTLDISDTEEYEYIEESEPVPEARKAPAAERVAVKTRPATRRVAKRRRFGFYRAILLIMIVLFVAIGAGTRYLWGYISAYEGSRLENVIEYLQDNVDYEFWQKNVENALRSRLTEFETGKAVPIQPYLHKIHDVRYILRQKSDETTAEAPVYIIRAGALDIGIVRFIPTQSIGHGFFQWDVGNVEFLDSFVDTFCRSIAITASANAIVLVNDIPVSRDYYVDCEFDYGVTYMIHGLYGDVDISVIEFDGRESGLLHSENGWFLYPITVPFAREYNIVIPEDGIILVDGEPVSADKITDDRIVPEVFIGAIDPAFVPAYLHRYEFELDGLYVEPVVVAVDAQGRELLSEESNDAGLRYANEFSAGYKEQHSATVERFIRAYVDFAANIGGNTNENITNLNEYVLRNSELYRRVRSARSSMEWVGGNSVTYNGLEIDNFRPYGDKHFSCEVNYSITNRTRYGTRELEGRFEVLFELSGGKWLAVNMVGVSAP